MCIVAQTKIAHLSDTHLGKCQYGSDGQHDDFLTAFERAIDVAVENDVDAVVHTGDLFDDTEPTPSTVAGCTNALNPLGERDIPLYAILGNHDRRNDDRWEEFVRRTNVVTRLGREPRVVGNTALYGIDAVRVEKWGAAELCLAGPPAGVDCTILCMHELLEPPGDEVTADYPLEDVLDRVDIDLDGLALGGYHQPASGRIDGTAVWYAGATKRFGANEAVPGAVQLVEIDDGAITHQPRELETRPIVAATIAFDRAEDVSRVREVLDRHDLTDAAAKIELVETDAVTAEQVTRMARDVGATTVDVDDDRGNVDRAMGEPATPPRPTARNAVETAALRSFRRRWKRDDDAERHGDSDEDRHGDSDEDRHRDSDEERHGVSDAERYGDGEERRNERRTLPQ